MKRRRRGGEGHIGNGASGADRRQTQLLPWGAPSAKTGSAPSVLRGRGAACKRRRYICAHAVLLQVVDESATAGRRRPNRVAWPWLGEMIGHWMG